ncbi:unnamed protein product [Camellia sinensis]
MVVAGVSSDGEGSDAGGETMVVRKKREKRKGKKKKKVGLWERERKREREIKR